MFKYLTIFLIIVFHSCGIYSFSGASISSDVKSISIKSFENRSSLTPPSFSNQFTNSLIDKFSTETNLTPLKNDSDIIFEGYISNYSINPIAIQANEIASQNRLSISIKVIHTNLINAINNYEKTFSRYIDYDSSLDFPSIEESLNEEIIKQITEDIFNETFSNW